MTKSYYDRFVEERTERNSNVLGGIPVFRGTRISVGNVGQRLHDGETIDHLVEDHHPHLTEADVVCAYVYYRKLQQQGPDSPRCLVDAHPGIKARYRYVVWHAPDRTGATYHRCEPDCRTLSEARALAESWITRGERVFVDLETSVPVLMMEGSWPPPTVTSSR